MTNFAKDKVRYVNFLPSTILVLALVLPSAERVVIAEGTSFGPSPSFIAPRVFPLSPLAGNPRSLVLGDFNGDGKSDVAVANYSSPTVAVALANGDGTFGTATTFAVGSFPSFVTTRDVNGDGILDLLVANSNSLYFSVLLGNGSGDFGPAINAAVGTQPQSLAVADFNSDGLLDVVTANAQANSVSRLLGDGAGHFTNPVNVSVGSRPVSIAAGDFDGDSKPDVVITNFDSGNLQLLLNNGLGSLGSPLSFQLGTNPEFVTTRDLNGDSKLDVVVANFGSNNVSVLLGTGAGSFGLPINLSTGLLPYSVIAEDLNDDGKSDLAVANRGSNDISIFLGDGLANFTAAPTVIGGPAPQSLGADDFDHDGHTDLALVNANPEAYLWVFKGNGDGTFVSPPSYPTGSGPFFCVTSDFNADGKLDLATANFHGNDVSILIGDGTGHFDAPVNYPVGSNPRTISLADFNKDSRPDLLVLNGSTDVSVLLATGTGTFGAATNLTFGTGYIITPSVSVGDFDGDGNVDIVGAADVIGISGTNMSILFGNGAGAFSSPITFDAEPAFSSPVNCVTLADFNADGKSDIAIAIDSRLSIIRGNNTGDFAISGIVNLIGDDGIPTPIDQIATGDINDDGRVDLFVNAAHYLSVLLGHGDGTFGVPTKFPSPGWVSAMADFNNDGKMDLAMVAPVSILNGDGAGAVGLPTSYSAGPAIGYFASGDFDGDGKIDLAVPDGEKDRVFILFNQSPGSALNPIDNARTFVRQQYLDFLNREPDLGGWDYWTAGITQCGADPRCIHNRRIDVSAAFFIELEFQETGYVIYRLHRAAFGTWPGTTTRANLTSARFMMDRSQLVAGPGLPESTANFANAFVQRSEFLQMYPGSLTNAQFVNQLFDTAGLIPFAAERQQEIDAMNNSTVPRTRAQVLLDVIEIPEFKTREFNGAFVLMQYFGYLRRDPDQGGYDFWLDVLDNHVPGNFRGMVCAFLTSAEYQHRFGAAVTRTDHDCGP